MASPKQTFSESWYRIADVKASLRPTVKARKQRFRGEDWVVLQDPFNNKFFRLRPESYAFVSRLEPERTIEEVWALCLELDPENTPGQEDVSQLLTQLHLANLLYYNTPSDSENFFARYRERQQRELQAKLIGIMFMRIPLIDPERLLKQADKIVGGLIGWLGASLWLLVVLGAVKIAIDNAGALGDQAQSVLAPDNLLFLYLSLILIKTLHEFGHAIICRHLGGEVHTMGVMLIVFTPLPYVDTTSSWAFRNRWHRALVGSGGMLVELFIAAIAVFVWANTGSGVLHSLAYNIIFIASVSTLLFNANPLLRFDGYYILSDLLDVPNLYTRGQAQLKYLAEKFLFGCEDVSSPSQRRNETFWLGFYGVTSMAYRFVIFVGIILFVGDKYLILGVIMAAILITLWLVRPPVVFVNYLLTSPALAKTRLRAMSVSAMLILLFVLSLGVLSFPDSFRAPGVMQSTEFVQLVNNTSGKLEEVFVTPGTQVKKGTPIARMSNWDLENQIKIVRAQWRQVINTERVAHSAADTDLEPIEKRKGSILAKMQRLMAMKESLVVLAAQDGVWIAPYAEDLVGSWLVRGSSLGLIVDPDHFYFSAVISQDEASDLFDEEITDASIRVHGQAEEEVAVLNHTMIPFQHERLPSAALGWRGGGDIAVSLENAEGTIAVEPFFRIDADIDSDRVTILHGASGLIRFSLTPKPLLVQWERNLRQLLQRRYNL
jgi:putative peptide zinc metalloprotease protein